jgi:pterin-4a-carbinolamine dehydratase
MSDQRILNLLNEGFATVREEEPKTVAQQVYSAKPEVEPEPVVSSQPELKAEPEPADAKSEVKPEKSEPSRFSDIKSIINENALAVLLERKNLSEILDLSVKELLADLDSSYIGGPWQELEEEGTKRLYGEFEFTDYSRASYFLARVLSEANYEDHHPLSLDLKMNENGWILTLMLGTTKTGTITEKDIKLAQYANYCYTEATYNKYIYSETQVIEVHSENNKVSMNLALSENSVQFFEENGKKYLKVPVARIGTWKHPEYGDLEFTQQDFNEIIQNFSANVLGYEPPLFLGHPITTTAIEGHPAEGFLVKFVQEDQVLFSIFEVVNDETYADVEKGKFRYSSGEFIRNYSTKEDGEEVGTTLVGMALTNRPFLTGLPRVSTTALADSSINSKESNVPELIRASDPLTPAKSETVMSTTEMTETINAQAFADFKAEVLSEFNKLKEDYAEKLAAQNAENEQKLTELQGRLTAAEQLAEAEKGRADAAEQKLRDQVVEAKLAELNELVLPAETKETYSEMIRNGSLGESEAKVMESLRQISSVNKEKYTEQQGDETASSQNPVNPYASTIERNAELARSRESQFLEKLSAS